MPRRRETPQPPTAQDTPRNVDNVDNVPPPDDRQQIEKLCRLPTHYSRVAAARAMRAVRLTGRATLDDLAAASDLSPMPPRAAERLAAAWTAAGDAMTGEQVRGDDGEWIRVRAAQTPPAAAVATAQATDERWVRLDALRPAARWAADLARRSGQWADDAWIGAASEDELRERARLTADALKDAIARRAAREGRGPTPDEQRRIDPAAQLRALRKRAKAARQFWSAALQLTGGPASDRRPAFADDFSLGCYTDRQDRAQSYGEANVWTRDDGQSFSAWAIMQSGATANLNRLYVQSRGLEDIAEAVGLGAVMLTITLPPEWHPNPSRGNCAWTMAHDPAAADRELQRLWTLFRARLARLHVCLLGLRVVEGHDDGCPHLHALLFVADSEADAVDTALRAVRPDPWDDQPNDTDETRAAKAAERADRQRRGLKVRVATDFVRINRQRARPSTYVLKYLLKSLNVDPKKALKLKGLDLEAQKAIKTAVNNIPAAADIRRIEPHGEDQIRDWERHRALASERRWRRYSLLGVHGMQRVWQRLVRLDEPAERAPAPLVETWRAVQAHPAMSAARQAMRCQRWCDALVALGAVRHPLVCDKDAPRAKLLYQPYTNQYGEPARRPVGIRWSGDDTWAIRLSDWTWTPGKAKTAATKKKAAGTLNSLISLGRTVADSYPRSAAVVAFWYDDEHARELEKLIADRQNNPAWSEWCRRMQEKVVQLRGTPPPTHRRRGMIEQYFDTAIAA